MRPGLHNWASLLLVIVAALLFFLPHPNPAPTASIPSAPVRQGRVIISPPASGSPSAVRPPVISPPPAAGLQSAPSVIREVIRERVQVVQIPGRVVTQMVRVPIPVPPGERAGEERPRETTEPLPTLETIRLDPLAVPAVATDPIQPAAASAPPAAPALPSTTGAAPGEDRSADLPVPGAAAATEEKPARLGSGVTSAGKPFVSFDIIQKPAVLPLLRIPFGRYGIGAFVTGKLDDPSGIDGGPQVNFSPGKSGFFLGVGIEARHTWQQRSPAFVGMVGYRKRF